MDETLIEKKIEQAERLEKRLTKNLAKIMAVRHAESVANTQGVYQGRTYDTDLSELGKKQAESLANRLTFKGQAFQGVKISRIITSPLKRAYQTALEISKTTDIQVEINELILETNHGEWEGMRKHEIVTKYPELYNQWLSQPSKTVFPNGETFTQTYDRVVKFLDHTNLEDGTLLVTHDNVIRVLVTLANGWKLDDIWKHDIESAALNFFEVNKVNNKNRLKILRLNDNIHLEGLRSDLSLHAL